MIKLESSGHIRGVEYRGKKNIFQIQTPSRTYFMAADNSTDRDAWVDVLNQALVELHPAVLKPAVGVQDFELLKLVGKGSFGKVMQVKFRQTGEVFAMKVLSKQHIVEHNEVCKILFFFPLSLSFHQKTTKTKTKNPHTNPTGGPHDGRVAHSAKVAPSISCESSLFVPVG